MLEKKTRKSHSFLQGALILSLSMVVVKVLGAIFKIPLASILGGEGNGYFKSAYELYNPLYALATAGFPIAISRMVSENVAKKRFKDVKQIHRISVPLFMLTGSIGFLLMVGGAFIYPHIVSSPDLKYSIVCLAPTVLLVCLMSIYRGYYEGLRNMTPTAMSEIIEAVGKVVVGLGSGYAVIAYGMNEYTKHGTVFGKPYGSESLARSATLPFAAAGAILGITLAAFAGFLYLVINHKLKGDGITQEELDNSPAPNTGRETLRSLVKIAVPVGLGALVMNVAGFIDATLIQTRLNDIMQTNPQALLDVYKGLISSEIVQNGKTHVFLWGCFGFASTLTMLVSTITAVFGISALPSVTTAWAQGDRRNIKDSIESVMRVTMLVTLPAGLGIVAIARPIMATLYGVSNEVVIASNILLLLGIASIFMAITTPLCSMLQAIGRVDLPVKLLFIGVIMKIILNYSLVGIPQINIQGAGAGSLVCYLFVTVSAMYFLCKETKIIPNMVSIFIKPLVSAICCAFTAYISYSLLSQMFPIRVSTVCAVIISVILYMVFLLLFRAITANDIKRLPKGKKFSKMLEKWKLL